MTEMGGPGAQHKRSQGLSSVWGFAFWATWSFLWCWGFARNWEGVTKTASNNQAIAIYHHDHQRHHHLLITVVVKLP